MPPTKSRRRPPLSTALSWFVPALALVAIATLIVHPLVLVPLLLANAVAMGAACHAIGFAPEPSFGRTVLRRGAAYLVMFTAYVALVLVLVAWPLVALSTSPSLGAALLLSVTLAMALAALWRAWPAFGLVFVWDDAFPATDQRSWIFTAVARSLTFARHLSAEERFFTHFLPSALCLLLLAVGALLPSGLYDVLPAELRTAALWLYGLVVLPLCSLVIANRTLRALLYECGDTRRRRDDDDDPGSAPEHLRGPVDTPQLSPRETTPGVREEGLLKAVREGDIPRALAFLQADADPDTAPVDGDSDQRSVLVLATLHPQTRLLRELIAHGADVNRRHRGTTALLAVTRDGCMGRAEAVMTLLANGADVAASDGEGNTALHFSARGSDLAVAADLLDAGAPVNALNARGHTPLAVACRAGNWPMVELLLQHRAATVVEGGEPALVAAAGIADDDPHGVRLLLKHKARVDACDALQRNALMTAALEGHAQVTRTLIEARATVDAADAHGTTALMEAARIGATEVASALCTAGAPVAARDRHGRDALTLACLSPHARAATVAVLVQAGADPRATDDEGRSALDCAVAAGRWDLVALLDPDTELPASVAVTASPDPEAATPDHLLDALRFGHWAIVGSFTASVRQWPAQELARLYLELAASEHARARRWLLDHGLRAEQTLASGQRLFDAGVDALPDSADALRQLMAAGASPAGAGLLARALQHLRDTPAPGLPLVLAMLDGGADPFGPLADGRTPLHLASAPGWHALLRILADAGCDPDVRDADGRTPLHAALAHAAADAEPALRVLIEAGADPEVNAANGETPLGLALGLGHSGLLRWLRWAPWPLPMRRLRADDLPAAAAAGDVDAIGKLLQLGFAVNAVDARGASALVHACGHGHAEVVTRLLDAGADIGRATAAGVTPLAAAASMRRVDLIAPLVERGAAVDQRLPGEATALMLACARGHADVAQALIEAGAAVDAQDARARNALHAAAQYGFDSRDSLRARRLLDVLLAHAADVNAVDAHGWTPLLLLLGAHEKPDAECDATHLGALLPVLLDAGARHEHADQRGVTALHACAMHALLAPARVLLARGADRGAVDAFGRCSADVARQLGYTDIAVELAERRGGIPDVRQTLRAPAQPAD